MMKTVRVVVFLMLFAPAAYAATNVPVPSSCTPAVNQTLATMIADHPKQYVENVMVCGVAAAKSQLQAGGAHGNHHVVTVRAVLPGGKTVSVQVVSNDSLDGMVVAKAGDAIYAFGQGYITHGAWVAGIHDVHCSTHPTADNGWVVVAGVKTPKSCPAR